MAWFPVLRPPTSALPREPTFVGLDDTAAFRVGEPAQTEGWGFVATLYAWLTGIALALGVIGLVIAVILFRAWQRGELGTAGGTVTTGNCSLGGDVGGACSNNSLALVNLATPGLCSADEVLVNGEYDEKGRTIGGSCQPRDPIVNSINITCGLGEILQGPFELIQTGRLIQLGAICVPRLEVVRNSTLDCPTPGQVLTSPFLFDIYGRLIGGSCTTPSGNGSLPDINNGTQTCPPGLFIVGSMVAGTGLVSGPFSCISNVSSGGALNPSNVTCPSNYYMNFTLLEDGRGFQGSCVELRLAGAVQGPMNATIISPVASAVTCGLLEALAGATRLVTGQVTGGSCVSFVSNNTLPVINNATNCSAPGEYSLSTVTTDTGLTFHPVCVLVTPQQLNGANLTCPAGYYTSFTLLTDGRGFSGTCVEIRAFGSVQGPLNNTVLATVTSLASCGPTEALAGETRLATGLSTGGTCTSFVSNNSLPVIQNQTNCSAAGEYALSKVVTNTGLSYQPVCVLVTPAQLNVANISCPAGYFMRFTLLTDGRGFSGTCIELRALGDITGPLNATTITPVTTLLTCSSTGVLAGATRRATGQTVGGTCIDFASNVATNCTGVDEYALAKVVTTTGLAINPVCRNVTGSGGSFTSLVATANQTQVFNEGGGNWRVATIQPNDPQADVRWGKARIGVNTAFATQGPSGGLKLMSFDANPANGNNLAFYRTDATAFPTGQMLNTGTNTMTLLANNYFDGTNYRATYTGISFPALAMGSVGGSFVSSSNGLMLGFSPPAGAPGNVLGTFTETFLMTPQLTDFYTPTNVKTPLGLFSVYNAILAPNPEIQTVISGVGDSWLSFGMYVTAAGTQLSSGNFDNFKFYHFGSSLFLQRKLATAAGTPVSATTTNIIEFNGNGFGMFATGQFNPSNNLFFAPLGAGNGGSILMDGYMDAGTVRASATSTPIVALRKTTLEFNLQYSNGGAATSAPTIRTLMRAGSSLTANMANDFVELTASNLIRPPSGSSTGNWSLYVAEVPTAPQIQIWAAVGGQLLGIYFNSYLNPALGDFSSNSGEVGGSIVKANDEFLFRLQAADVPIHNALSGWNNELTIRRTETEFRLPPAVSSYTTTPSITVTDSSRHIIQSSISVADLISTVGVYESASTLTPDWVIFYPGCGSFQKNVIEARAHWTGHTFTLTVGTDGSTWNQGGICTPAAGATVLLTEISLTPSTPVQTPICGIFPGTSGGFTNSYQCCYDASAKTATCFLMTGASPASFLSGTTYSLPVVVSWTWVTSNTPP